MRDRNIAPSRQDKSFAGVAICRGRVKPRARPRASEAEDVDHKLDIANRRIARRHGAAADRLDRCYAGVVGTFGEVARAQPDWSWIRAPVSNLTELGKHPEKIDFVAQ